MFRNEKLIVGFDLGDDVSQISFCTASSENVETLSSVSGEEYYSIPTVLCKRSGVNQWFFGKEALSYADEKEGILIENLLQKAIDGEMLQIEDSPYDPVALLALFFKRCLGMLSAIASSEKLEGLMITCDTLDSRMVEVLNQVIGRVKLKTDKILYQSHTESFYQYMLQQPGELWQAKTILLDYQKDRMIVYRMECNRRTKPVVVYIDRKEEAFPVQSDQALLLLAKEVIQKESVSGVYLVGESFSEDWMKESLRFLCSGRRVFQGNNLYSKGACFGMLERIKPTQAGKEYVFLGNDKLKANVGMKLLRRGEESYLALLDAGQNWFEAQKTVEFYIKDSDSFEIIITSLVGKKNAVAKITLNGLESKIKRLKMHLFLTNEELLVAEISDLGLGEMIPAKNLFWREEIPL